MSAVDVIVAVTAVAVAGPAGWALRAGLARRRRARSQSTRRILFPFVGGALSEPVLEATLRLARSERATLVPAYLAIVPLVLPLSAAVPRQVDEAVPLLEAVEQRATRAGVPVDSRIERGRTHRHALRELFAHEQHDRVVVAADDGPAGFDGEDVAWLLRHAGGEVLVLRPAAEQRITAPV